MFHLWSKSESNDRSALTLPGAEGALSSHPTLGWAKMLQVWPPDMKYLEKWSTQYMKTPGNWARPETWLENTLLIFFSAPCKIQGIFFAKKVVGHNFWTEGPTDLRLTFLSCIFDALFGDTPLDHIFSHMPICPYAHFGHIWPNMPKMGIWAYGHMWKNMVKWGIPEKSIKNATQKR